MRAAFFTLGCKVNQYETQILQQSFRDAGFEIVDPDSPADVFVVNSCTVTGSGDKKTRQMLRHFRRQNPGAVLALTGCFPQAFPAEAAALPEADVVTGSTERASLLPAVQEALRGRRVVKIVPHRPGEPFEPMRAEGMRERTRAFVKIEDGCDNRCSYCIIPTARGPVRSKPLAELREELAGLRRSGYEEAVLVGVNLPLYGRDTGETLVEAAALACGIFPRVRLGSLEPELLRPEDIRRLGELPAFCPQFHLSLQSGCDRTLRAMRRRYDTETYRRVTEEIRAVFENPALTTDVMVGFPGESEEDFSASVRFVGEIGFAKVHVFPYSRRAGTAAAEYPGQISQEEKAARAARMSAAAGVCRRGFLQSQLGREEAVLLESRTSDGRMTGYTPNYTPVSLPAGPTLLGTVRRVFLTELWEDGCGGVLI